MTFFTPVEAVVKVRKMIFSLFLWEADSRTEVEKHMI